ncbi:MAG: alanine--tRNA ligase-related protein, partial [Thermoguttaceae bacterium]
LETTDAKIIGIIAEEQLCDEVEEVDHENPIVVVLDKTPFYGEMGGQLGDTGELVGSHFRFEVTDTQVDGGFTLHRGHLREGRLTLGDRIDARVDVQRRQGIRRAHSATHLLHHALQNVLGGHALQQGSKVDDDLLRFDFANPSAVTAEQLDRIEDEVNAKILAGEPIGCQNIPLADARKAGATMLFGEKYPDMVRMVTMGDFSRELCGGTHLTNTGQIGVFQILSEESVAAGTRRITALTGCGALRHIRRDRSILHHAAAALRVPDDELADRIHALQKEVRQLKKQATAGPKGGPTIDELVAKAIDLSGVKLVLAEMPGGPNELRQVIDQLRRKISPVAVLLANRQEDENKLTMIAGLSRDLVGRGLDAVTWIRDVAKVVDGGGGGRPDMAQAGGKLLDKLPDAFDFARDELKKLLG